MKNLKGESRRKFLTVSTSIGTGVLLGSHVIKELEQEEEMVLITADGKLVKVNVNHLPQGKGIPTSNKDLQDWMQSKDKNLTI
jgi:hypothetical protein